MKIQVWCVNERAQVWWVDDGGRAAEDKSGALKPAHRLACGVERLRESGAVVEGYGFEAVKMGFRWTLEILNDEGCGGLVVVVVAVEFPDKLPEKSVMFVGNYTFKVWEMVNNGVTRRDNMLQLNCN